MTQGVSIRHGFFFVSFRAAAAKNPDDDGVCGYAELSFKALCGNPSYYFNPAK
jgi:hypothetical protein